MDSTVETLLALARDVRARTLHRLAKAQPAWLTRTVPGTVNHLAWHAGHVLWVQDAICITLLSGQSELPAGWEKRFSMESNPAKDGGPWPTREELLQLLDQQLQRMEALLQAADLKALAAGTPGFLRQLVHGFHDEAIHQGEMLMLEKMFRAHAAADPR